MEFGSNIISYDDAVRATRSSLPETASEIQEVSILLVFTLIAHFMLLHQT